MPESRIRLEVIVLLMRLNSILVGRVSARRTLEPSDRTTFASGATMNAKGSLRIRGQNTRSVCILLFCCRAVN